MVQTLWKYAHVCGQCQEMKSKRQVTTVAYRPRSVTRHSGIYGVHIQGNFRPRLRKRNRVHHCIRTSAMTSCINNSAFSGGSSFFTNWAGLFSFASFLSFFLFLSLFFFFGTRLLTLRNLRYVATRVIRYTAVRPLPVSQRCLIDPQTASRSGVGEGILRLVEELQRLGRSPS